MDGEDRDKINYSLLGWVDSLKRKHSNWNMRAGIPQHLTLF